MCTPLSPPVRDADRWQMHPRGLVLSPTRELCLQVGRISFYALASGTLLPVFQGDSAPFFQTDNFHPAICFFQIFNESRKFAYRTPVTSALLYGGREN